MLRSRSRLIGGGAGHLDTTMTRHPERPVRSRAGRVPLRPSSPPVCDPTSARRVQDLRGTAGFLMAHEHLSQAQQSSSVALAGGPGFQSEYLRDLVVLQPLERPQQQDLLIDVLELAQRLADAALD